MTNWQAFDHATGKELVKGDKISTGGWVFDHTTDDGKVVTFSATHKTYMHHIGALESGTATGRSAAIVELQRMADLADLYIAKMREGFPVK